MGLLLDDDDALRRLRVIFAHKRIAAWRQRADAHDAFLASGDDLFPLQAVGIELVGDAVGIGDLQREGRIGLHHDLGGREFVILEQQRDGRRIGGLPTLGAGGETRGETGAGSQEGEIADHGCVLNDNCSQLQWLLRPHLYLG